MTVTKISEKPKFQNQPIYIIFDATHEEYYNKLRLISDDLDEWKGNFIPRLNPAGNLGIIQIKVGKDKYPWIDFPDISIIGVGNRDWAYLQTTNQKLWEGKFYNPWKIHRDFCTGKITKEEYEQLLEEGRGTITLKKTKE